RYRRRITTRPAPPEHHQFTLARIDGALRPGHPPAGLEHCLGFRLPPAQPLQRLTQAFTAGSAAIEGIDSRALGGRGQLQAAHLTASRLDMRLTDPAAALGQAPEQEEQP